MSKYLTCNGCGSTVNQYYIPLTWMTMKNFLHGPYNFCEMCSQRIFEFVEMQLPASVSK